MHTTDVLVVGAGPAGLATAVSALRHGARVLVAERRPGTSTVPRANGLTVRTMELFRFWGIDAAVRAAGIDCDPVVEIVRSMAEEPREVVPLDFPPLRAAVAASPAFPALCPQDLVEPLLVEQVRRLGGEVRFGAEVTDLRIDADGVRARVGTTGRVRARFVVGADGPRSGVRAVLGIGWQHLGTFADVEQVLFRPDLTPLLPRRPAALAFVEHPAAGGVLMPMAAGRWAFAHWRPEGADALPGDRWTEVLRTATGLPDLRPEVLGAQRFTLAADVATAYRAGPGFLVGDAAHRMTPQGGLGMNTAVHDGHELGWRLGWAVRGLAAEAVLDSYATEREPVGRANAARTLRTEREPDDGLPRDLGGAYRSAVIADDGAPPATGHSRTARPGERAPHAWVRRHGRRHSVLDLFEDRLTLVVGADGAGWRRAADHVRGVPLQVLQPGHDVLDRLGQLGGRYRLGAASAVLVRPDGVVAWRHDGPVADRATALTGAVALALGRAGAAATLAAAG